MSLIPGTNIRVDNFANPGINNSYVFILSHMHTDHLKGLTDDWDGGRIYTSEISARLLVDKFPSLKPTVIGLPMNQETVVFLDPKQEKESVSITLLDANHCLGSSMILLKGQMGTILHTGDFWYNEDKFTRIKALYPNGKTNGEFAKCSINIDLVVLDSTFGAREYTFISQDEAQARIETIVQRVRDKG